MAAVTPTDTIVVSLSLLESVTIHRTSNLFSLGMEEFTESYLKSLEERVSAESVEKSEEEPNMQPTSTGNTDDSTSLRLPTAVYPEHTPRPFSSKPHPQELEPPPKKQNVRFQILSSEELGSLCKPNVPRNTQTSTK